MTNENNTITEEVAEDIISKTKGFIRELARVQDIYYESLKEELNLTEEGEEFLFDYIYNWDEPISFKEHLKHYNIDTPIFNKRTNV